MCPVADKRKDGSAREKAADGGWMVGSVNSTAIDDGPGNDGNEDYDVRCRRYLFPGRSGGRSIDRVINEQRKATEKEYP